MATRGFAQLSPLPKQVCCIKQSECRALRVTVCDCLKDTLAEEWNACHLT